MMFSVFPIKSFEDKLNFLNDFDPKNSTWVVSDLTSKFEIQKKTLASRSVLEEDGVLRANELWLKLLRRLRPEISVVSSGFMTTLISRRLAKEDLSWVRSEGGAKKVLQYIEQFLPIFSNESMVQTTVEWLRTNESAMIRWGQWFNLSYQIWKEFQGNQLVIPSWISGILVNEPNLIDSWGRTLIIDLGPDLSGVELDIIQTIAKGSDVKILMPDPAWRGRYSKSLTGYKKCDERSDEELLMLNEEKLIFPPQYQLAKYTTMIAEVKDGVATIRNWLNSGVAPNQIALVAPEMETYWASLSEYLREEGIPYNKDDLINLQSFPDIIQWLSRLKLEMGVVNSGDIELSSYSRHQRPSVGFERFRSLFSVIYSEEDLGRLDHIEAIYDLEVSENTELLRDEFVGWSLRYWKWSSTDNLNKSIQRLLEECPPSVKMSVYFWNEYLGKICAQIEVRVNEADSLGIQCVNLNGSEWLGVSHVFVLGLVEEALVGADSTEVNLSDVMKITSDLGIQLSYPDNKSLEFKVAWFLQRNFEQFVVSVPSTDFSGRVQAPSLLWLNEALNRKMDLESVKTPELTRWDEIQHDFMFKVEERRKSVGLDSNDFVDNLEMDFGERNPAGFGQGLPFTLSVSKLESYGKCPFLFAARHLFHLDDLEDLDVDIDRMTRGRFIHRLFEELLNPPIKFDWNDNELEALLEQTRKYLDLKLIDEDLWPALKKKYRRQALRFLDFEKSWRANFPKTITEGREVFVSGAWSKDDQCLRRKDSPGRIFNGVIDRIDSDGEGNLTIVDYKSSGSSLKNFAGWLKSKSFQMILYKNAVEMGLSPKFEQNQVVCAGYLDAKKMTREKGFGFEEFDGKLFKGGRTFKVSPEKFEQTQSEVLSLVGEVIEKMEKGEFAPNPDLETRKNLCPKCRWNKLCRAPHLN